MLFWGNALIAGTKRANFGIDLLMASDFSEKVERLRSQLGSPGSDLIQQEIYIEGPESETVTNQREVDSGVDGWRPITGN